MHYHPLNTWPGPSQYSAFHSIASPPPPTSAPFPVSPARPDCLNRNVTVEITATRGANARSLARAARLI